MVSNEEILERVKKLEAENQLLKKKLEVQSGYKPETLSEEKEESLLKKLEHRTGRRDLLKMLVGAGIVAGAAVAPSAATTITDEGINTGELLSDIDAKGHSIDNLKSVRTENIYNRSDDVACVVWRDDSELVAVGRTGEIDRGTNDRAVFDSIADSISSGKVVVTCDLTWDNNTVVFNPYVSIEGDGSTPEVDVTACNTDVFKFKAGSVAYKTLSNFVKGLKFTGDIANTSTRIANIVDAARGNILNNITVDVANFVQITGPCFLTNIENNKARSSGQTGTGIQFDSNDNGKPNGCTVEHNEFDSYNEAIVTNSGLDIGISNANYFEGNAIGINWKAGNNPFIYGNYIWVSSGHIGIKWQFSFGIINVYGNHFRGDGVHNEFATDSMFGCLSGNTFNSDSGASAGIFVSVNTGAFVSNYVSILNNSGVNINKVIDGGTNGMVFPVVCGNSVKLCTTFVDGGDNHITIYQCNDNIVNDTCDNFLKNVAITKSLSNNVVADNNAGIWLSGDCLNGDCVCTGNYVNNAATTIEGNANGGNIISSNSWVSCSGFGYLSNDIVNWTATEDLGVSPTSAPTISVLEGTVVRNSNADNNETWQLIRGTWVQIV